MHPEAISSTLLDTRFDDADIRRQAHRMNDPTRADITNEDRKEAASRLRAAVRALRCVGGQISEDQDTVYIDGFLDHVGKIASDLKQIADTIEPDRKPKGFSTRSIKPIPVVIRDVEYPSMAAAARAFDLPAAAIREHMEEGSLDFVGEARRPIREITIRGTTYTSMKAAAKANNVRVRTVRKHRDAGTLDLVGNKRVRRK